MSAVDVAAIASQSAGFGIGTLQQFQDTHGALQELARLLELMLAVLGPVRNAMVGWCASIQ